MKIESGSLIWGIGVFVWSIFMGITAIAIGVGAVLPSINQIAAPFACPNGQMRFEQESSNPLPGTTYTLTYWSCQNNATGETIELEIFPMVFYSGTVYGLLVFAVVVVIWYIRNRRSSSAAVATNDFTFTPREPAHSLQGDTAARLRELERLRAENLISASEYEQKRAEILSEL
jgi:hypothetical protein